MLKGGTTFRRWEVAMADKYASFADMADHNTEGVDYWIQYQLRNSTVAIVAPHGGGIEPGTSELAYAIAGDDLSFYVFEAIKPSHNQDLHITSTNFFEPRCDSVLASCSVVVTVHGQHDKTSEVFVGGKTGSTAVDANKLRDAIKSALQDKNIAVVKPPKAIQGEDKLNLCNRGTSGAGIQLELSHGLRASMFENVDKTAGRATRKQPFDDFVAAIRTSICP
jgi:phage replication-related protein YjqB (UPF0714/DUF867 family)